MGHQRPHSGGAPHATWHTKPLARLTLSKATAVHGVMLGTFNDTSMSVCDAAGWPEAAGVCGHQPPHPLQRPLGAGRSHPAVDAAADWRGSAHPSGPPHSHQIPDLHLHLWRVMLCKLVRQSRMHVLAPASSVFCAVPLVQFAMPVQQLHTRMSECSWCAPCLQAVMHPLADELGDNQPGNYMLALGQCIE